MSFLNHLPKPAEESTKLLQVKIPESLYNAAVKAREKDGFTWHDLVVAGLKSYLEERVNKRREA